MTTTLSPEANQLVIQTLTNIKKSPCSFNMTVWAKNKNCFLSPTNLLDEEVGCGTSMCFAGWLVYTYGKLHERKKSIAKISLGYPFSSQGYSFTVTALRMLDVEMMDEYQFQYMHSSPKRKNSKDAALRLTSVFADKTIKTVEELEARLLKYKLLTYETQQTSEACEMVVLS